MPSNNNSGYYHFGTVSFHCAPLCLTYPAATLKQCTSTISIYNCGFILSLTIFIVNIIFINTPRICAATNESVPQVSSMRLFMAVLMHKNSDIQTEIALSIRISESIYITFILERILMYKFQLLNYNMVDIKNVIDTIL